MIANGITVQEHFIPLTNKTSRPGIKRVPTYITIHNTGNPSEKANARMHTEYIDKHPGYISWHFSVDDIEIYQEMPCDEVAYHAGTKAGNDKSIGIEICETGDYAKAEENAAALVVGLMKEHKIPIEKVVPHQFWSGKYCPHIILDAGWDKFVNKIKKVLNQLYTDVSDDRWSYADIKAVTELGLMGGHPDGSFKPTDPVTREQMAAILNRFYKLLKGG
jgi:N-acetylmuramoyl-L-alanine amidase